MLQAEASRRILLEQLPPVLVLHIKCFVYDKSGGCQKVVKQIDFGIDLEINKGVLYILSGIIYLMAELPPS